MSVTDIDGVLIQYASHQSNAVHAHGTLKRGRQARSQGCIADYFFRKHIGIVLRGSDALFEATWTICSKASGAADGTTVFTTPKQPQTQQSRRM